LDPVLSEVMGSLQEKRFVTLLGPGGIGKTTIAVAVGHAIAEEFGGEVYFVDLGSLTDRDHVVRSVEASLGLVEKSNDVSPEFVDSIRSRKLLMILDSCEHVIEAVASIAEQLFQGADQVHLLATSRELLRVEGEHCYRVPPLESPPADSVPTADNLLRYPAVQLFVERDGKRRKFRCHRRRGVVCCRYVPKTGRSAARHRIGCRLGSRVGCQELDCSPRIPAGVAETRTSNGSSQTSDPQGNIGLELRSAIECGEDCP
jgi:hypothetical protein